MNGDEIDRSLRQVVAVLADVLEIPESAIGPADNLFTTLGVDSLAAIAVFLARSGRSAFRSRLRMRSTSSFARRG